MIGWLALVSSGAAPHSAPVAEGELATRLQMPPSLARYLAAAGFGDGEYDALANGRAASRLLESAVRDELGVVAVVRVNAPASRLLAAYRDIVAFESGPGVLAMGVFSTPPRASDVGALQLTSNDLRDLRSCRVGDCDINLPAAAIQRFGTDVDWSSRSAPDHARRVLGETLVHYVARYAREGTRALVVYQDTDPPIPIGPRSEDLFGGADKLVPLPRLRSYFERFNAMPLPDDAHGFFYWQQVSFGMKPVTRVNQVVISPFTMDGLPCSVFMSRMIYASHYFRDGLEIRYIVPLNGPAGADAFYLVLVSRSHSESLVGFKGFLLGGAIRRHVRNSMATYAGHVREAVEALH